MELNPEKSTKAFKLCYKNEIHRIAKIPTDYKSLVQNVYLAFKDDLPPKWALQYEDQDGDRVMLSSDDDYKAMLECELDSPAKTIKIFLLPLDDNASLDLSTSEILLGGIQKTKSVDYSAEPIAERNEAELDEQKEEIPAQEDKEDKEEKNEPEEVEKKEEVVERQEEEPLVEEEKPAEAQEEAPEVNEVNEMKVEEEKEEETDEVHDLMEKEESSSAQMDDAIDTHDDDNGQANEKPEKRKMRCKREKKELSSESPVKDQARRNLRKEQKKEKLRSIVTDLMFENAPALAEIIKEYLNNPSAFNLEEIRKKTRPQDEGVHEGVACDGCGMKPIVGARYKCSVCDDFDYCTRCEASIEHPHHFLKIKGSKDIKSGHGEEDGDRHHKKEKKGKRHLTEKSVEAQKEAQQEKPVKNVPKEQFEEVKVEEPKLVEKPVEKSAEKPRIEDMFKKPVEHKEDKYGVAIVREVQCVPMKITTQDKSIYKTLTLKNTGKIQWPKNALLINIAGVGGQDAKVSEVLPGKEMTAMFIIQSPGKAGEFTSSWQLSYIDDSGDLQFAGEPITFGFVIHEADNGQSEIKKKEEEKPKQPVEPKPVPVVEPKKEDSPKKQYPEKVRESARLIKEFLPEADIDALLEFVATNPKSSMDELVDKYLAQM